VDDLPERAVVAAHASREREPVGLASASRADGTIGTPGSECIAAADATGRRDPRYFAPASSTDWTRERLVENVVAGDARRREQHTHGSIRCDRQHMAAHCKAEATSAPREFAGCRPEVRRRSKTTSEVVTQKLQSARRHPTDARAHRTREWTA
jgi:hypothetical protein